MSRQTPTSRRSPSILVTDARKSGNHKAPFVRRKMDVSVDSLISQTSEVPSAQRRAPPPSAFRKRKPRLNLDEQTETTPLIPKPRNPPREGVDSAQFANSTTLQSKSHVPLLPKPLAARTSKQSQRHVLIPEQPDNERDEAELPAQDDQMRVSSYLVAESINLRNAAQFLKKMHKARVRLYDEALFGDYLLPLLPGDDVDFRIRSSVGDNRTMEKMIDLSEQHDHHYEYFGTNSEADPSEPVAFTPPKDSVNIQPTQPPETSNPSLNPAMNMNLNEMTEMSSFSAKERYKSHAEIFLFNYGVVVFWNFTEVQEKQVLADLCLGSDNLLLNLFSDQDIECEEMAFAYTDHTVSPKVVNDLILLNSGSHMLKLAMSHALAQSTVLMSFEQRMQTHFTNVSDIPKTLALTGKLGINREQLLKISGQLFKLRVDVNLSSNVLDIPEFFWNSEPSLFPLFSALREYLEIDERVLVLNDRQSVFLELTGVLGDSIAEFNMDRITLVVIWLIVLSIVVSLSEIMVRFFILKKASGSG